MPAKSERQRKAAGAALSAKRGEQSKKKLREPSKKMAESMTEEQLEELASKPKKNTKGKSK